MKIKIVLEKGEDGFFVAHCPSLKSCWSQGKTEQEALQNIKEAIELYMDSHLDCTWKIVQDKKNHNLNT